jgi:hypothetical protein
MIRRKSNYLTVNDQSNIEFFIRFFVTTGLFYNWNYLFLFHGLHFLRDNKKNNYRVMHLSRESLGTIFLLDQTNMLLNTFWSIKCMLGHVLNQKKTFFIKDFDGFNMHTDINSKMVYWENMKNSQLPPTCSDEAENFNIHYIYRPQKCNMNSTYTSLI